MPWKSCLYLTALLVSVGTFEDNVGVALGDRRLDIAFVDAIHT
jgi:hypothetical protein